MFWVLSSQSRARRKRAQSLYEAAAMQARKPEFFIDFGVPDTFDGRFEILCLHVWLVIHKLKGAGQDKDAQAVFDAMFRTLDMTVREMGIGDLSVPRHMKRMMTGFNGRASAYQDALGDEVELMEALKRNVYGTLEGDIEDDKIRALADYVREAAREPLPKTENANVA